MTQIEITLGMPEGKKHLMLYDRIVVIPDEGEPVDISNLVRAHRLVSRVGDVRMLEIELFAVGEITGYPKEEAA